MRGGLRLAMVVWTAGLVLGPAPLAAQSAPATTTNTPAADAVGPKELQNFSLSGTVTRACGPAAAADDDSNFPGASSGRNTHDLRIGGSAAFAARKKDR